MSRLEEILAQNARDTERGYREKALRMYPHFCGRCGREFSGRRLSELTVHHRDHNHDNNPPDGSNWELLCLYCHDNEHQRQVDLHYQKEEAAGQKARSKPTRGWPDWLTCSSSPGISTGQERLPCCSVSSAGCSLLVGMIRRYKNRPLRFSTRNSSVEAR